MDGSLEIRPERPAARSPCVNQQRLEVEPSSCRFFSLATGLVLGGLLGVFWREVFDLVLMLV